MADEKRNFNLVIYAILCSMAGVGKKNGCWSGDQHPTREINIQHVELLSDGLLTSALNQKGLPRRWRRKSLFTYSLNSVNHDSGVHQLTPCGY
jgi:hypothetical protein